MILTALSQYHSTGEPVPFGYATKRSLGFDLIIDFDAGGCQLLETYQAETGKRVAAPESLVPNITRSNNPPPMLGCDTAPFVFGRGKPAKTPEAESKEAVSAARKHAAFRALLAAYGAESEDPDATAYLLWVESGMPGLVEALAALTPHARTRIDMDLIAVSVGTSPRIHTKLAAQEFWSRRAQELKAGGGVGLCIACGQSGALVDTLPQALTGALIPATKTSQVALVSANFPAASRRASGIGLQSAPICAGCASRAVTSFNELAGSDNHRWRLGDRAAAIWWTTQPVLDGIIGLLSQPQPKQVRHLLDSVLSGQMVSSDIEGEFYLMVFSGNVARLVVRRFIALPLLEAARNVGSWYYDVETVDPKRPLRALPDIARSAGKYVPSDQAGQSPDGAFEALLLTALADDRPPQALLHPAVARAKAEAHRLDAAGLEGWQYQQRAFDRLALFKLILNRTVYQEGNHMTPGLDEDREVPAYLSGRLFAVRQNLQWAALGEVNASIVDRYFGRASAHPASVDRTLALLSQQHLRALQRKSVGASVRLGAVIRSLHNRIGVAPGRLSVAEQAEWIAGYYQQRESDIQAAIANKKANTSAANDGDEEN